MWYRAWVRGHDLREHSQDDPAAMRVGFALYCPRCQSRVFRWLNLSQLRKAFPGGWLEKDVSKRLHLEWAAKIPQDCDEALALNAVRAVHES